MKQTIIFAALFTYLASGYNTNLKYITNVAYIHKANLDENTELSFDQYLKQITSLKLPLRMLCEEEPNGSQTNFNQSTIDKYGIENSRIYGKLAETEKFAAVMYLYPGDIILPIIVTSDKSGNKISELPIYERWCGEDEFSQGTSWAKISKDLLITLGDSVVTYKRNAEGQIIEESKSTEVRHRNFKIDPKGRIKEQKLP